MIDDIYSIENGLLKKNITEELQLKNIFSIDKNAGLGILKDTGKTIKNKLHVYCSSDRNRIFCFDYDMLHQAFFF